MIVWIKTDNTCLVSTVVAEDAISAGETLLHQRDWFFAENISNLWMLQKFVEQNVLNKVLKNYFNQNILVQV